VIYAGPSQKLSSSESDALATSPRESLSKDLSGGQTSPHAAATGTLNLSVDITEVNGSYPLINVVTIAAVFVPLYLGGATVTAWIADRKTGQVVAEIDATGCGQILSGFGAASRPPGQSRTVLNQESRTIAKEAERVYGIH
jgi:hypothetical protein